MLRSFACDWRGRLDGSPLMPAFRAKAVRNTPEVQRIISLRRRELRKSDAERYAREWTAKLALRRGAEFRPWPAYALAEARKVQGLLGGLPVGQGKTLLAETLPVALESQRSALILPASLESKTYAVRRSFAGTWRTASPPPRIITREYMHGEDGNYILDTINGTANGKENLDLLIIDEADELANFSASTPTRIDRFVTAKRKRGKARGLRWPYGLRVVCMTGTLTRNSLMGYWHLIRWCLGDDLMPLPASRAEAEEWAAALDNKAPRAGFRPSTGPLGRTLDEARAWYLDRLEHTPGIMLVDEDSAVNPETGKPIPLHVGFKLAPECPDIDDAFETLMTRWESPSGEPVSDPLSFLRISGQLGCGLVSYWKPPPPAEWIAARRELAAFVRRRIKETRHSIKPLDTDAQVIRRHPDAHYYSVNLRREVYPVREWLAVRKTFDPRKAARVKWLSDATVERLVKWIDSHRRRGIPCVVWSGSVEFGQRLAEVAGVPYYGREGKERTTGRELHAADVAGKDRAFVASWHANKRGFDLQDWRTHAIVYLPQSAKYLEQIIGRPHRTPRKGVAEHLKPVRFTVFLTSGGTLDSWERAVSEARFAKDTAKSTQKILRAKIATPPLLPETLRWARKNDDGADDSDALDNGEVVLEERTRVRRKRTHSR